MAVARISKKRSAKEREYVFAAEGLEREAGTRDPLDLQPDELRDRLRTALSALSFEEYGSVRREILAGLHRSGINVGASFMLIGASTDNGEVLPSDMAHLVRYLKINQPESLTRIRSVLVRLFGEAAARAGVKRRLAA